MYPKTLAPVAFRSTIIQNLAATAETVPFERRAAHGIVSGGTANRQVGGGIAPKGRTGSKGIGPPTLPKLFHLTNSLTGLLLLCIILCILFIKTIKYSFYLHIYFILLYICLRS